MFIRQMVSEPDGSGSSNRVCAVGIIMVLLVCILYIVFTKQAFPEIPQNLGSLLEWIIAALLFGNVAKNWVASRGNS